jgi:hypothetical protein
MRIEDLERSVKRLLASEYLVDNRYQVPLVHREGLRLIMG